MTLTRARDPWDSPDWSSEIKWDGWRCLARIERDRVILTSRQAVNLSAWFPHLQGLHACAAAGSVLDGELVVFGDDGRPDFDLLKRGAHAVFVAFDVLRVGRRTLLDRPLFERQEILGQRVAQSDILLRSVPFVGRGCDLFAEAQARKLEGVVLKRLTSTYTPGPTRTGHWVKVKTSYGTAVVAERMRRAHEVRRYASRVG